MNIVFDALQIYLPAKRKQTPSGWLAFNAPCCEHNGTTPDTRQRGGLIANADEGVSFHCFNCGFKTSWRNGRKLSFKMKKFMRLVLKAYFLGNLQGFLSFANKILSNFQQ